MGKELMEDCFGRQTGNLMLSTYSQEDPLGWPNFRCLILSTRVPEKTALDWGGGGGTDGGQWDGYRTTDMELRKTEIKRHRKK